MTETQSSFRQLNKVFSPDLWLEEGGAVKRKSCPDNVRQPVTSNNKKKNIHTSHEVTRQETTSINLIRHKTAEQHSGRLG